MPMVSRCGPCPSAWPDHGRTALYFKATLDLKVASMSFPCGLARSMWFDETGLLHQPPNLPNPASELCILRWCPLKAPMCR